MTGEARDRKLRLSEAHFGVQKEGGRGNPASESNEANKEGGKCTVILANRKNATRTSPKIHRKRKEGTTTHCGARAHAKAEKEKNVEEPGK